MAIYRCNKCDELVDDDYYPCTVDPEDDTQLICPNCAEELDNE